MKKAVIACATMLFGQQALAVDIDAAANDVCGCLEAPYKLVEQSMQELSKAQASGDYSKLMEAQGEMMGIIDSSSRCFEDLPRKYPEIDKDEALKSQVMEKANAQCPNPAENFRPPSGDAPR